MNENVYSPTIFPLFFCAFIAGMFIVHLHTRVQRACHAERRQLRFLSRLPKPNPSVSHGACSARTLIGLTDRETRRPTIFSKAIGTLVPLPTSRGSGFTTITRPLLLRLFQHADRHTWTLQDLCELRRLNQCFVIQVSLYGSRLRVCI